MKHSYILIPLLLTIAALTAACAPEKPVSDKGVRVENNTVVYGQDQRCTLGRQPLESMRQCGMRPRLRERALRLLLAEEARANKVMEKGPSADELLWMARTLYVESPPLTEPGADYEMSLIANVITQRRASAKWPDTVHGVVSSPYQFTGIHFNHRRVFSLTLDDYDNQSLKTSVLRKWRRAVREAEAALTAPDSLRPPAANAYANLQETEWKSWMDKADIAYTSKHHTYFRLPERQGATAPTSAR